MNEPITKPDRNDPTQDLRSVILTGRESADKTKEPVHKEVESKSFKQTTLSVEDEHSTKYIQDFTLAAQDYWRLNYPDHLIAYRQGIADGKFGRKELTIPNFFDRIYSSVRQLVLTVLGNNKETAEDLNQNFKALEATFKLLGQAVKTKNNKKQDTEEVIAFCAQLQGFVNSFIENNIENEED